jgi:hypothetical protein
MSVSLAECDSTGRMSCADSGIRAAGCAADAAAAQPGLCAVQSAGLICCEVLLFADALADSRMLLQSLLGQRQAANCCAPAALFGHSLLNRQTAGYALHVLCTWFVCDVFRPGCGARHVCRRKTLLLMHAILTKVEIRARRHGTFGMIARSLCWSEVLCGWRWPFALDVCAHVSCTALRTLQHLMCYVYTIASHEKQPAWLHLCVL